MAYDNPRPSSQPVGSVDLAVAKDDLITLDLMVTAESGTEITNRKGQKLTPLVDVVDGANSIIADELNRAPFQIVGDFADGFQIDYRSQVGQAVDGTIWRYTGALPFTVPAGTVPSSPTYEQLFDTDHDLLSNLNGRGHGEIHRIETTVAEVATGKYQVDDKLTLTDRAGAKFNIVSGGTANGFDVLDAGGGNTATYVLDEHILVDHFGATPALSNCTSAYDAIINYAPNGTVIKWQSGKTYTGNFVSDGKSFHIDANNVTLVDSNPNTYILAMLNTVENEHSVSEAELNRLDEAFTVIGADGLFSEGDIGYLWDSAIRPADDAPVNFELVKISRLSGNTIFIEGGLRSYKGAGAIKFYHFPAQLKDCSIKNLNIECSPSFAFNAVAVMGVDKVRHDNITVKGSYFDSVTVRKSYDVTGKNTRPLNPRETVLGGTGYGLNYRIVTNYTVKDVRGNGCRHVYDQDDAYRGDIEGVEDLDDKSSCCVLAHNGFTSDLTVSKIRASGELYPVSTSDQGYGAGANRSNKDNHPLVNVTIEDVTGEVKATKSVNDFNITGVYLRQNTDNVHITKVKWAHKNAEAVNTFASSGVRIDGIPVGNTSISRVSGDKIGRALLIGASTGNASSELVTIDDIDVKDVYQTALIVGRINFNIDNVNHNTVFHTGLIEVVDGATQNINDYFVNIGSVTYRGVDKIVYTNLDGLRPKGDLKSSSRSSQSTIAASAGSSLTLAEFQNRTRLLRLSASGDTIVSPNFIPTPLIDGQEVVISALNANITIPAGGTADKEVVILNGESVRLVSLTSLWRLV